MSEGQGTLQKRYMSAADIKNEIKTSGTDAPQNENYKNASWLKKLAISLGLEDVYDMADDYLTGRISQQKAYDLDIEKMKLQQEYDKEMWEKTNKYNSSQQQLKRWLQAGGNPNAFFGGGTNTGNAPMTTSPTGGSAAGTTVGILQGATETTANMMKAWWEARKTKAEAEGKEIENGTLRQLNEATIQSLITSADAQRKAGLLSEMEATQIKELLPGLKGKTNAEWEKIKQDTLNLIEQNEEIKERTKNLRQDTKNKILEANKLEWEKLFRQNYGVDPNSGPIQMLIQNILTGKGTNVMQAFLNFVSDTGDTITENLKPDKVKNLKNLGDGLLFGNPGLIGITYGFHKMYQRNRKKTDWKDHAHEKN